MPNYIRRSKIGLENWQIIKVTKDEDKLTIIPNDPNYGIDFASIRSEKFMTAFNKRDWKFFDNEYSVTLDIREGI